MNYSSRVQAVVSAGGPTELASCYKEGGPVGTFIGASPEQAPDRYKKAQPLKNECVALRCESLDYGNRRRVHPFASGALAPLIVPMTIARLPKEGEND